jgi:hypothetical protein
MAAAVERASPGLGFQLRHVFGRQGHLESGHLTCSEAKTKLNMKVRSIPPIVRCTISREVRLPAILVIILQVTQSMKTPITIKPVLEFDDITSVDTIYISKGVIGSSP